MSICYPCDWVNAIWALTSEIGFCLNILFENLGALYCHDFSNWKKKSLFLKSNGDFYFVMQTISSGFGGFMLDAFGYISFFFPPVYILYNNPSLRVLNK